MIDVIVGENGITQSPPEVESKAQKPKKGSRTKSYAPHLFLIFAALLYMFLAIRSIDNKYVDYGDGNYLYVSWRVSLGEVLYQDVPSPQPPIHLFFGALLLYLTNGDPILIRLWQVIEHVLIGCCVAGISFRIFSNAAMASLAGAIYLFMPEGVWWAAGYQSEGLLILFQSISVFFLLNALSKKSSGASPDLYISAFFSAMSCYVNMTALPYMALQWFFMWWSFRKCFKHYSLGFIIPAVLMFIWMQIYSHGQYIEHVFNRQVGTFPTESFSGMMQYFLGKLYNEGGDILFYEGGFVLTAIAGLFLYSSDEDLPFAKDYLFWWAIFSLGSIIFVTKGGTVEYIFTIGEPAVAVFSAFFLITLMAVADIPFSVSSIFANALQFGKITLLLCVFLPALLMKPCGLLYHTFTKTTGPRGVFELDSATMDKIANYVDFSCPENKLVHAPPIYAFQAKRKIADNSVCLFIFGIAYLNEWKTFEKEEKAGIPMPDLNKTPLKNDTKWLFDQDYYDPKSVFELDRLFQTKPELQKKYPVINTLLDVRRKMKDREVPIVIANVAHTFYNIPIINQAIRENYRLLDPKIEMNPREEVLRFYKVK